jgi:1-acyl-sn-glycerol-3-phosphate acyltransferase
VSGLEGLTPQDRATSAASTAPAPKPDAPKPAPATSGVASRGDLLALSALLGVNRLFARVYHRLTIENACPLPRSGPAILICNHIAGLDPILLQASTRRLITWMMAREYFEIPILCRAFTKLGYIPVSRDGKDASALKAALRTLGRGRVLGLFPEGRIATGRDLLPFQPGVALLARRTGAPVYPAYLSGNHRSPHVARSYLRPAEATVRFGPRIVIGDDPDAATADIANAVARLKSS